LKRVSLNSIKHLDCIYCGERAAHRDHVIAYSYNSSNRKRTAKDYPCDEIVPACQECNLLLSNFYLPTIAERAAYLAKTVTKRNKKVLESPDWAKEDIKELGYGLRKNIQSMQFNRGILKDRIAHMENMSKNDTLTPTDYWDIVCERHGVADPSEL